MLSFSIHTSLVTSVYCNGTLALRKPKKLEASQKVKQGYKHLKYCAALAVSKKATVMCQKYNEVFQGATTKLTFTLSQWLRLNI